MLAIGALLRKALTLSMLKQAWLKVAGNKGMAGVDGETIDALSPQIDTVLRQLAKAVVHGGYRPQPLLRIWAERPGKSPRGLAIPTVRDRILQTSLTLVLTPKVEAELEDSAYAYRQGRGVRTAVERIGFYQRQGYHWIVDADIESFFDAIPHADLLARLQTVAPEPALIGLVEQWLTAPIQDGDLLTVPQRGIPQGSPISPMLANLYLDTLDEALLDNDHILIRYADDFIVLAKSQKSAEAALDLTKDVLERLTLRLNPLKTRIVHFDEGLEFLGWYFVRSLAIPKSWQDTPIPRNFQPAAPPPPAATESGDIKTAARPATPSAESTEPAEATEPAEPAKPPLHEADGTDEAQAERAEPALPPLAPLQRTLYLVDKQARLSVENQRYTVERNGQTVLSLPAHQVDQIMLFGPVQVTTQTLQLAARHGCGLSYLSYLGRYYGRFEPENNSQIALLQAQFACHADSMFQLDIARQIVAAKLHNSRVILARGQRHLPSSPLDPSAGHRLKQIEQSLKTTISMESLRGSEGAAAALYWQAFGTQVPPPWTFDKRRARPALDPVNALLSLGYTLLYQAVAGLLQARSLNAHLGMLHIPGGNHLALASDLMEVFRAYVVDATVLRLLRGGQLDANAHSVTAGACSLGGDTIKIYIRALEDRFNSMQQHPQTGVEMDLRRIIDADILTLVKAFRAGDANAFLPTRWR